MNAKKIMTSLMLGATLMGAGAITANASSGYKFNGKTYATEAAVEKAMNEYTANAQKNLSVAEKVANLEDVAAEQRGDGLKVTVTKKQIDAIKKSGNKKTATKTTTKKVIKKSVKKVAPKGYKVTSFKATKEKGASSIKVSGRIKVNNKAQAKKHRAKYAVVNTYKGKTAIKISKKGNFSKTIANRKAAKRVSVAAAYKSGKTYKLISSKKNIAIKNIAKQYAYKITNLTSQKSTSKRSLTTTGKFAVANKSLAAKNRATYVRIHDYKGTTYVKLNAKKNSFKKTVAKRFGAKHVDATIMKRSATKHGKKTVYTYHTLSAKKTVSVKTAA